MTQSQEKRILVLAFRHVADGAFVKLPASLDPALFLLNKDAGLDRPSLRTLPALSENV